MNSRLRAPLVVDEAYFEYGGEPPRGSRRASPGRPPHVLEGVRSRGSRVGYAVADRETAAELNRRQAPRPSPLGGRSRCGAAATRARRRPTRSRSASGCARRSAAGLDPASRATSSASARRRPRRAARARGSSSARPQGIRITFGAPPRTTASSRRSGPAGPAGARGDADPHHRRDSVPDLSPSTGSGRSQARGRLSRSPAHALRLPRWNRSRLVAAGDLEVDEHHTVEDVLATLGSA